MLSIIISANGDGVEGVFSRGLEVEASRRWKQTEAELGEGVTVLCGRRKAATPALRDIEDDE